MNRVNLGEIDLYSRIIKITLYQPGDSLDLSLNDFTNAIMCISIVIACYKLYDYKKNMYLSKSRMKFIIEGLE